LLARRDGEKNHAQGDHAQGGRSECLAESSGDCSQRLDSVKDWERGASRLGFGSTDVNVSHGDARTILSLVKQPGVTLFTPNPNDGIPQKLVAGNIIGRSRTSGSVRTLYTSLL
jgi:hypothetical protein